MIPVPWEMLGSVWPLMASMALLTAAKVRAARRRVALNRALHELRRPLQALLLSPTQSGRRRTAAGSLEMALAALDRLDDEVNGTTPAPRPRPVAARALVCGAIERWRARAAAAGRSLTLEWRAGAAIVDADPARVAQALDNLLANAIEHGGLRVRVQVSLNVRGVRILVASDGPWRGHRSGDPRRGHGLAVARRVAGEHGGRLAIEAGPRRTVVALELPLAPMPPPGPLDWAAAPVGAASRRPGANGRAHTA